MKLSDSSVHPKSEEKNSPKTGLSEAIEGQLEVDTYAGKVFVEWAPDSAVTPLGQLPFFIHFLKWEERFDPWVEVCPLSDRSNNAPAKRDVLGSLFLSILSGHRRYAHLATLQADRVNTKLLGMDKVVSDDSAIRTLQKMPEEASIHWLQEHLLSSCDPLLR